jgi:hypothetical protein
VLGIGAAPALRTRYGQAMSDGRSAGEKTWDQRILEVIPSGVDVSQIDENLRLTPTERVEKMRRVLLSIDSMRAAGGDRLPKDR